MSINSFDNERASVIEDLIWEVLTWLFKIIEVALTSAFSRSEYTSSKKTLKLGSHLTI